MNVLYPQNFIFPGHRVPNILQIRNNDIFSLLKGRLPDGNIGWFYGLQVIDLRRDSGSAPFIGVAIDMQSVTEFKNKDPVGLCIVAHGLQQILNGIVQLVYIPGAVNPDHLVQHQLQIVQAGFQIIVCIFNGHLHGRYHLLE